MDEKKHAPGWVGEWMFGWMELKAVLRIAYSNQKVVVGWMDEWIDGWSRKQV